MDAIAKTSLLTAAMRAMETKRNEGDGRLFSDPYAELLAGKEGLALLQKALAESGEQPAIAVRTQFMDEKIKEAIKNGVRQIVILAAGMDTRAYRLSLPKGTRVFELDRQEVLDYKQEKLSKLQPHCARQTLAVDLREEWHNKLLQAGLSRTEQTLWLVEGLIMYLDKSQVSILFGRLSEIALPNDILLFDVLSRTLLEAPHMKKQLQFLESIGAPWRFGENEPEKFMEDFRWKAIATQPGEFAPSRWPFPTAPRGVPNVPRSFFIEARKE